MPANSITGCILARNEERRIGDALASLSGWTTQQIVLDDGSTDRTVAIAHSLGAEVIPVTRPSNGCFDALRNEAIPRAGGDWIFFLDADERVPPRLGPELVRLVRERGHEFEALLLPFKHFFCGRWMRNHLWWPGYTRCQLLKKGHFRYRSRLHAGVEILPPGRTAMFPANDPDLALIHASYDSLEEYVDKLNRYTDGEVVGLAADGASHSWQALLAHFVQDWQLYYDRSQAVRDGMPGFVLSFMSGIYRFTARAKLWDIRQRTSDVVDEPLPRTVHELLEFMAEMDSGAAEEWLGQRVPPSSERYPPPWQDLSVPVLEEAPLGLGGPSVTTCILARNEARRLAAAIASVRRWTEQVLVLDHGSSDETAAVAREMGADVVPIGNSDENGFDALRNLAVDHARGDWLFFLDADERVPAELGPALRRVLVERADHLSGVFVPFQHYFCGRWIRHSGWWPGYKSGPQLVRKDRFRFSERLHTGAQVEGPTWYFPTDDPELAVRHHSYHDLHEYLEKANRYTTAEARALHEARASHRWEVQLTDFVRDWRQRYEADAGWRDGMHGFVLCFLSGFYRFTARAKLWDLRRRRGELGDGDDALPSSVSEMLRFMREVASAATIRTSPRAALPDQAPVPPAPAPEPVPLIWAAPLYDTSGFADEAREAVLGLVDVGEPVALAPLGGNGELAGLPDAVAGTLQAHTVPAGSPAELFVAHLPLPMRLPDRAAGFTIVRTMFETDRLRPEWVTALQEADRIWVPSEFNRETFLRSGIAPEKLAVVPGGIDPAPFARREDAGRRILPGDHSFTFLSLFDWSLRKGWDVLLGAFAAAFGDAPEIGLVVKVSSSVRCPMDQVLAEADALLRERLGRGLESFPNIHLWREWLPAAELPRLYHSADCFVLPARGEGWSRPLMAAMASGLPTIATAWSGITAYHDARVGYPLRYRLTPVTAEAARETPAYQGHCWADPDPDELRRLMLRVVNQPAEAKRKGEAAQRAVCRRLSRRAVARLVVDELQVCRQLAREQSAASAMPSASTVRAAPSAEVPRSSAAGPEGVSAAACDLNQDRARWAAIYQQMPLTQVPEHYRVFTGMPFLKTYLEEVLAACPYGGRALETGIGFGYGAIWLSLRGREVEGIDYAPEIVRRAEQINGVLGGKARFRAGNFFALQQSSSGEYDVIFHQGVLEHFSDDEIRRILAGQVARSRRVVFSVPSANYPFEREFGNERLLSLEEWRAILAPFELESLRYYGDPHLGAKEHVLGVLRGEVEDQSRPGVMTPHISAGPTPARRVDRRPLVWMAPLFDPSGYADEARTFILGLLEAGEDVAVLPFGWSSEDAGLDPATRALLESRVTAADALSDLFVSQTTPPLNKPSPHARLSICRTMFETDRLRPAWASQLNRMDQIWVPSEFNRETFTRSGVDPDRLAVVPGAIDAEPFLTPIEPWPVPGNERFRFLTVYDWMLHKGWDALLEAFVREFGNDRDAGLILKTWSSNGYSSGHITQQADSFLRYRFGRGLSEFPNVHLWFERIPTGEMARIYRAVDAFVLPTRGEGWGRPLMEAMTSGLPTIATAWSGVTAFHHAGVGYPLKYRLVPVSRSGAQEIPIYQGHYWADPDVSDLQALMRHLVSHRDEARARGAAAREEIVQRFSRRAVTEILKAELARCRELADQKDRRSLVPVGSARAADPRTPVELPARAANIPAAARSEPGEPPLGPLRCPPPYPVPADPVPAVDFQSALGRPLRVRWEGDLTLRSSLALVNRELCLGLLAPGDVELSFGEREVRWRDANQADRDRLEPLQPLLDRELSGPADITIRHAFPPDWSRPAAGKLVVMQPWEYGHLPKSWVDGARHQADEVWAYSRFVRAIYVRSGVTPEKVRIVPLGVRTDEFRPDGPVYPLPTQKQVRFLYVGGTIPRKGADLLLAAYRRAFTRADDVCLVVKDMGTATFYRGETHEREFQRAAADAGGPEVIYLDRELTDPELASLYRACSCVVLPYRGEGFALAPLEGMACGLPVIVTAGGPTDDYVDDQVGLRLPARRRLLGSPGPLDCIGDPWNLEPDPAALVEALRWIKDHPAELDRRGQAGAERAASWGWDRSAACLRDRLLELLGSPPTCEGVSSIPWELSDGRRARGAGSRTGRARRANPPRPEGEQSGAGRGAAGGIALSLCMIVRNEEKRVEACLRSIAPYVDEMVVVDTGSSDRTCEIASACGARVFQMPWPDSFAAARNESLQHARGQWVFWMDADDVIPPECGAALREVVERDPERRAAYQVAVRLPAGPGEFSDAVVDHIKLFPNRADLRFEHRIHEQILPAVRRAGLEVVPTELYVIHRNYDRSPDGQAMKRHRDFRLLDLDLRDRPEHPFVLFNLGMTHLHATKEFEVAANYLQRSLVQSHPADSIVRKAHAMLTTTYVCREEWEDAALANEAGRQVYPDDAELLFQAGQIYQQLGRFDDARAALERLVAGGEDQHYRSVDVGLRTYRGHHELALLFRRMGDLAHCEGILQDLVRSHPDFAPARLDLVETLARLGRLGEARLELSRVAEDEVTRAHIQRLWHLVGPPTWPDEVPTPLGSRDSDSPLGRLAARYPYPLPEPRVSRHEHGWLQAPTREALAQVLSPATRVVLELGSWLGLSTRFVADCAPNATVIAVDHWQGSVEHQQNPELAALLAVLYETFIANCWDYRERIVPVRRTTLDGMAEMAELGVEPDVVYIDGSHDTESVRADLETALDRFPNATVVGDDWFGEGVQQAVQAVITARQLDSRFGHNATAWWIVPEGGPPGRAFAFRGSRYAYCRLTREMAMNERAVSLALALAAVESCHGPVLELGNVLESYGRTGHIVADAEGDADLRHVGVDQFGRDTRFDAIVSVSLTDYLVGVDRRACDLDRADRLLRWVVGGLLRPGGTALICVPLGIWPDLDRMILAGPQGYDVTCMRRITAANDWQEIPLGELGPPAYGMPYEFANAIAVLSIGFPCGRIAEGCSHASDPASVTPSVGERLTPPDWDAAPEFGRREGLLAALKSLWALRPGPSVLVETGTLRDADPSARESDGWSTLAWGWYAQATGGRAVTVDAASEAIDVCRELTHSYSNAIEYVNADSVSFLVEWERRYPDVRIDLLYLDSFDYFDRPASEAHNLREVETALPHLADLCLVLLDDTHPAEPTAPETSPKGFWGKGARTVPFLLERGFHLEWHREGQVLLARRASQQSLS